MMTKLLRSCKLIHRALILISIPGRVCGYLQMKLLDCDLFYVFYNYGGLPVIRGPKSALYLFSD